MLDLAHIKRIFQITAGLSCTVTRFNIIHSFIHSVYLASIKPILLLWQSGAPSKGTITTRRAGIWRHSNLHCNHSKQTWFPESLGSNEITQGEQLAELSSDKSVKPGGL